MSEMREYTVGELVVNYDRLRKPLSSREREKRKGIYPYYGATCIFDYVDDYIFDGEYILMGEDGTVINPDGSPVLQRISGKTWVNNHAHVLQNTSIIDFGYLYYALKNTNVTGAVTGAVQPKISQSNMNALKISIHTSIAEQQKVASVLKRIDEKIEQNTRINNNLEQQAKAIYHQMFIASSSPEWTQGTLSDIADITMGQSPSGSSYNEDGIGTVFYQGRAEFGYRFPTQRLCTTEPKRMARENDVLMSVRAPVGDLNVAREDCCIGRGLASIRSKTNRQSFVLYTVFALQPELDKFNGEGTVFGSINRDSLNKMAIEIPTDDEMDRFESLVSPMDAQIRTNHEEILRLETIRDALLPKLMTGELDVSAVEI